MNEPLVEVVEGWTGALPFTLKADGTAVDLTSLTVAIVLKNAEGTVIANSTAGVTVTGSTAGLVEYAPSTGTFVASQTPYRLRFKVTDSTGRVVYFPNVDEDLIAVNVI